MASKYVPYPSNPTNYQAIIMGEHTSWANSITLLVSSEPVDTVAIYTNAMPAHSSSTGPVVAPAPAAAFAPARPGMGTDQQRRTQGT